jgi:hypothetical protein
MDIKKIAMFLTMAMAAGVLSAATHLEVGRTLQDEAVAMAIDEGLNQTRYLSMAYGEDAQKMLDDAFTARGSNFVEGVEVVKQYSKGDIRNVPCVEQVKGLKQEEYLKFAKRNRSALFSPDEAVAVSGRMYGNPEAFNALLAGLQSKLKKPILLTGEGKREYRDVLDPNEKSYSFWPMGCAIHADDAYAEEVAHFFNFVDPKARRNNFKGTWSTPDYEKVAKWSEFLSALRGVKVYAYSLGYNLNNPPVDGVCTFEAFRNVIRGKYEKWREESRWPIATNAMVLLMAYEEAVEHEGKATDNAACRRLRTLCRDHNIAKMVL